MEYILENLFPSFSSHPRSMNLGAYWEGEEVLFLVLLLVVFMVVFIVLKLCSFGLPLAVCLRASK